MPNWYWYVYYDVKYERRLTSYSIKFHQHQQLQNTYQEGGVGVLEENM